LLLGACVGGCRHDAVFVAVGCGKEVGGPVGFYTRGVEFDYVGDVGGADGGLGGGLVEDLMGLELEWVDSRHIGTLAGFCR
jgi:hypothetical protein